MTIRELLATAREMKPTAQTAVLLVGPPHDKLYIYHLIAMIDFGDGEYHKYQNELQMANGAYKEYAKWWQRTKR
jgi:hypothetical protein